MKTRHTMLSSALAVAVLALAPIASGNTPGSRAVAPRSLPIAVDDTRGLSRNPRQFTPWVHERVARASLELWTLRDTDRLLPGALEEFAARRRALDAQLARAASDRVVSATERQAIYREVRELEEISDRYERPVARGGGPGPTCEVPGAVMASNTFCGPAAPSSQ